MTQYRITPDGRRRRLPDGTPRAIGQAGPAGTALAAGEATTSFLGAAVIGASVLLAAAGATSFGGAAQISSVSVGPQAVGAVSFDGVATISGSAIAEAAGAFAFDGAASGHVDVPLAAAGAVAWTGSAAIAQNVLIRAVPGAVKFSGAATGSLAASVRAVLGLVTFVGQAGVSVNTSAKWLSIWERVYTSRQKVLNAVDANNRYLAKQAGAQAAATATALVVTDTRVTQAEGKIEAEAQRITLLGTEVAGKASAEALTALTTRTTVVEGRVDTQAEALTAVNTEVGLARNDALQALTAANDTATALTTVRSEVQAPFAADYGWEFSANHRGFTVAGATLDMFPPTTDNGATVIASNSGDPNFISPVISVGGNSHPVVRAYVRRRGSGAWDGRLFWSNANHGFSGSFVALTPAPPTGVWSVIEWDLRQIADWRSGPLTRLRFDFAAAAGETVDVQWIALGNYGQGRTAQATETLRAGVDAVAGQFAASHTIALTVDGKVSGTRSQNNGVVSSFEVLADVFRVVGAAAEGMEWQQGYLRVYGSGYQRIIGNNFGHASDQLVDWFGPNVGASNANKANATTWSDKQGNAYFGGIVAQGVLRYANSSTTFGSNVEIATAENVSNNKPVQVSGRFQYDATQAFSGQVQLAPGAGNTGTTLVLERRYQGEGWVELARRNVSGGMALQNGTDGDGLVSWDIDGSIVATDVASPKLRQYRMRVLTITRQTFTQTGGSGGPVGPTLHNQYQSIESLE